MQLGWTRVLCPVLVVAGLLLIGYAVAQGVAQLYVIVIFPVLASSSPLVFLGVLLIIFGMLLLPLALESTAEYVPLQTLPSATGSPPGTTEPEMGGGGVLLVGPLPIFFGGWKHPSRRIYWLAVLVGSVALVLLIVAFLFVAL